MTVRLRTAPIILILLLGALNSCATSGSPSALADEYYNLGNEWFDLKKFDKAAVAYQRALRWNPELKIAVLNWARSKAELGDIAGALGLLRPVAASDPDNLVVGQYRAWLTGKLQGAAGAADLYAALALKLPGDSATQYNAGVSLWAAKRPEEALTALTAWKALDGKTWAGLSLLAEAQEAAESPETAQTWLEAASTFPENDSKRFTPLTRRAKVLEKAELYGDAAEAWKAAVSLPAAIDQPRGEAQFRLGSLLLLQLEDYQAGLEAVVAAWKVGYTNAEAWKALRGNPELRFGPRFEADLKLAEVSP